MWLTIGRCGIKLRFHQRVMIRFEKGYAVESSMMILLFYCVTNRLSSSMVLLISFSSFTSPSRLSMRKTMEITLFNWWIQMETIRWCLCAPQRHTCATQLYIQIAQNRSLSVSMQSHRLLLQFESNRRRSSPFVMRAYDLSTRVAHEYVSLSLEAVFLVSTKLFLFLLLSTRSPFNIRGKICICLSWSIY